MPGPYEVEASDDKGMCCGLEWLEERQRLTYMRKGAMSFKSFSNLRWDSGLFASFLGSIPDKMVRAGRWKDL